MIPHTLFTGVLRLHMGFKILTEMIPKCSPKRKMLSNEIPRSAELDDGSKASWPQRSSPSPSQRRQLDNFNYSDDGGLADRRCGSSAGPRPPRQCAELTSQSPSQKRSGAVAPTLVWGKGIICRNSPHFLACLPSRHAYCTSQHERGH